MSDQEDVDGGVRKNFPEDLLDWYEEDGRSFVWRREDITGYEMLVAEVFLQVTRAEVVEPVYEEFLDRFPDPEALAEADRKEVVEVIEPIGVYNRRADALQEIAEELTENGFPETQDELLQLPQVGRYAANATLCFGRGEPLPIIDSNVRRIYERLLGELDDEWKVAADLLLEDRARDYNLALLDFGSEVCSHHNPTCEECFAKGYCSYFSQ